MKKTILLSTLLAAISFASTVNAAGEATVNASQQFVWKGLVPVEQVTGTDFKIVQAGSVPFDSGVLTFKNDGGLITMENASIMQFKVVKTADNATPDTPFSYSLKNKYVTRDGRDASELFPAFTVLAADAEISVGDTPVTVDVADAGNPISLSVAAGSDLSRVRAGDSIGVSAFIEVAAATI